MSRFAKLAFALILVAATALLLAPARSGAALPLPRSNGDLSNPLQATVVVTGTATLTPTRTPTATTSITPTLTSTATATSTSTSTSTRTSTAVPTSTRTSTAIPTSTRTPTITATGTATATTQPAPTTVPFAGIYLPLVLDAGQGLPSPTATPLVTATPTPTASPAPGGIPVLSSSTYTTGTGGRYFVGEVRNDNANNVEFVKITARFFDAAGNFLGSEIGYTRLNILTPGQRSPFAITSLDPPDRYDHYALEVEASATQRQPLAGLTIVSPVDQPLGPSGSRSISGEVRNDSGGAVTALEIVATVYDQSGTVVATDVVNAQRTQLAAGGTSRFSVIVLRWDGGVRYKLQAQAQRP